MKICRRCESTDIYRKLIENPQGIVGIVSFNPLPGIGNWLAGATLWVEVCGDCGHLEFTVPHEYLSKIKEKFDLIS
jgi:hypothetical protein